MSHPQEQLAAYVDGTLEDRERAEVEAHLASCPACREEVELAGRARSRLASMPELDLPKGWVRPTVKRRGAPRPDRFRRMRWAAGVAAGVAAAAIVAGLVVGNLGSPSTPSSAPEGAAAPAPEHGILQRQGVDYGPAGIRALAVRLSRRVARNDQASAGTSASSGSSTSFGTATPSPNLKRANQTLSGSVTGAPVDCLRRGAGLPPTARALTAIEARYQGIPAYIGGFLQSGGQGSSVVVWVVRRQDCRVLGGVQQRVP